MIRTLLLLAALLLPMALHAAPMTYPVHRAPCAVTLDGEVANDPAWQAAPASTGFYKLGNGYANAKQTTARMLWDDSALYVGVVCEEPDAAHLKFNVFDYGDTWTEDSLEIFLQPAAQVYQVGVTGSGAKGGFEGGPDIGPMKAAGRIGKDSYSIEVCVPWAVLKTTQPKVGDKWRGEICRNVWTNLSGGDKFTSWTALQSRFLEPDNFATLLFAAGTLSPDQAARVTEQLNAPYRSTLAAQVKAASEIGEQYRDTLKEAQADPQFGEQARSLLREWRRIERLSKESNRAGILDIRLALMTLQMLNQQSYEVKYRYLINKLLTEN